MFEKLELIQKRYDELNQLLAQPEIATDSRRLQELNKEKVDLEDISLQEKIGERYGLFKITRT